VSGKPVMPFQWGKQTLAEQLTQMAPTIAAGLGGESNEPSWIAERAIKISQAIIERIYGPQMW
jgi:hypothetical protein